MKAPDKIYLHPDFEGSQTPSVFWGIEKRGSHPEECVEYIRKETLLEKVKELRDDAGSRDDHYEKDAIIEYNAYEAVMDIIKSM